MTVVTAPIVHEAGSIVGGVIESALGFALSREYRLTQLAGKMARLHAMPGTPSRLRRLAALEARYVTLLTLARRESVAESLDRLAELADRIERKARLGGFVHFARDLETALADVRVLRNRVAVEVSNLTRSKGGE